MNSEKNNVASIVARIPNAQMPNIQLTNDIFFNESNGNELINLNILLTI